MRTIQQYLPNPRHVEVNRIYVNAKPNEAWQVVRHFDMATIPWIRLLFDIRTWPDKMRGLNTGHESRNMGIDQIAEEGKGFMILQEEPGKSVVVGSIGQFWHLNIPFAKVDPPTFKSFNQPG